MGPPLQSDSRDGLKDFKGFQVPHLPFASSLWSPSARNVPFSLAQKWRLGTEHLFGLSSIVSHCVGPQVNHRWTFRIEIAKAKQDTWNIPQLCSRKEARVPQYWKPVHLDRCALWRENTILPHQEAINIWVNNNFVGQWKLFLLLVLLVGFKLQPELSGKWVWEKQGKAWKHLSLCTELLHGTGRKTGRADPCPWHISCQSSQQLIQQSTALPRPSELALGKAELCKHQRTT